jgi:glycosyltransferase involved in cell wall biosynthesis
MNQITLIIPCWNQPQMLRKQLDTVAQYGPSWRVIVVDDHSSAPAEEVFNEHDTAELYRVDADIPWNRSCARNLGAHQANTEWILHVDTDHILPAECANRLLEHSLSEKRWYRFPRFRVGKADETRNKDDLPRDCEYGQIREHCDSYLITKKMYWKTGGYDPDYAGCLGGGGAFIARLESMMGPSAALPIDIHLEVWTRDKIPDASVSGISRDTSEYKRRKKDKEARGDTVPHDPIRYPWHRVR